MCNKKNGKKLDETGSLSVKCGRCKKHLTHKMIQKDIITVIVESLRTPEAGSSTRRVARNLDMPLVTVRKMSKNTI